MTAAIPVTIKNMEVVRRHRSDKSEWNFDVERDEVHAARLSIVKPLPAGKSPADDS
jgi:hypothetical protein